MTLVEREVLNGNRAGWQGERFFPTFSASYPATPATVPMARRALRSLAIRAGATEQQADAVRLAASEALTNVVLYAYPHGQGEAYVSAWVTSEDVWVLIGDDGCGLQPDRDSDGLGFGLALIAQASDEFLVAERAAGGIELQMRFRLG